MCICYHPYNTAGFMHLYALKLGENIANVTINFILSNVEFAE